ncbi:MAG TPA: DnaJ domain-containing protein [Terrimicrobiaceae bacterium]|nr:DnaJ domain-containing protein [Terrimicrobiaceae bacterium]
MLDAFPDHYATLGLDRRCTAAQIRSAYRLLAKRLHPDLNHDSPEATARAQELNAAHEVLGDPKRRQAYDRDLADRERSEGTTPAPRAASRLERNIAQDVLLRIEDFLQGVSLEVTVNDPANPHGPETYPLEVPPDTAPGERFRLPRAEPFDGGFVTVRVKARPGARFKVRGSDLRCDLRISSQRAAQGGYEMIPGASARLVKVPVPAGVGRGAVIRIPGEGLPKARGGRGDLLVRISYRPEVKITRRRF